MVSIMKATKHFVAALLIFSFAFSAMTLVPETSYAQARGTEKAELSGTRKQLATIVFSGLAGAILGLSTLSFYGRPQDHLDNIAIGFALGIIGGAIFTTYRAATKPYDAYDISQKQTEFERETRLRFVDESYKREIAQTSSEYVPRLGWRWEF